MPRVPTFAELPTLDGSTERHSWGVFGDGDELGCLNFLTDERVAAASALIRSGERISLNLPIGTPARPFWAPARADHPLSHQILVHGRSREDFLDSFFLQAGTQWDALGHRGYRHYGYYGNREDADLERGELGIDRMARRGIFGRGVLVDAAEFLAVRGEPIDPTSRVAIDHGLIEAILTEQGVDDSGGDVLLVRTGWLEWFLALSTAGSDELAARFAENPRSLSWPGVSPLPNTVGWLWDRQVAAVAVDNPTVEAIPYRPEEGYLHHRSLAMMGLPLGELWTLEKLAEQCRRTGRYEFFLASAPLDLPRGVGSPANAYAIF